MEKQEFTIGQVNEAIVRLRGAGLTSENLQKLIENKNLAEQIVTILNKARKIYGKKILGNVWEIDKIEITPEIEKKLRKIRDDFDVGVWKRRKKREKKRREANKRLSGFRINH